MAALPFIRREVLAIEGYTPGEQPRDRRYVKLNTNENPYPPSAAVLDAVRAAANAELRLYPDPSGRVLREKASARYGLPAPCILVGNGSDELLSVVLRACIDRGDSVAYATPTYSLYDTLVALQGGEAKRVPYPADFRLPVDALAQAAARVTFVCNPNAPSGTLTPLAELDQLARAVSGLLVIDEAYVDFTSTTALALVERHPNVLVLRTFSKSFSLCGLRIGLAFAEPALIAELAKVRDSYSVNQLGLVAAAAALDDYPSMQEHVARIQTTRKALSQGLIERGFSVLPSETNFVLARKPGVNLAGHQARLKEQGVLVRYFPVPELCDALRITVGTDQEIERFFAALDSAV
jgi:histidinol-phosphate aminotransferase